MLSGLAAEPAYSNDREPPYFNAEVQGPGATVKWDQAQPVSWDPVPPPPSFPPLPPQSVPSAAPPPAPETAPRTGLWLAIGLAVALLLAAGGAWAWYAHARRNRPPANTASSLPPAPSAGDRNPGAMAPEQPAKPSPAMPTPQPRTERTQPLAPSESVPWKAAQQHPKAQLPEPNFDVNPPPQPRIAPPSPPAPRSGILHYEGPPVPHNGTVVFDRLPRPLLKFNFDHQAWSLTIKVNPDGTKRVTMTSRKPGFQTNCDLGWEVSQ